MTDKPDNSFDFSAVLLSTVLVAAAATGYAPLVTPVTLILLCYLPGRLVVAGFRLAEGWDAAGRGMLAVAVSLVVTPVVLNPLWHYTNQRWPLLIYIWLCLVPAAFGAHCLRFGTAPLGELRLFDRTRSKIIFGVVAGLVALVAISTYWPTELHGYPVPALIHDFVKHHAVLFSLEQRPLPLGNPFFADNATGPVYYYHFFYLIPASVRVLAPGVSIELAFGLQAALIGLTLAGMCYLFVKRFTGGDSPAILAALLATVIGGLDVIPIIVMRMRVVTLDAWADTLVRIHNLLTQIVWTPQNLQGVLVALVGVYVLSVKGWWRGWFVWGPILAASLVGSTVWVSAGILPGLGLFMVGALFAQRRQGRLALQRCLLAGLVGILMLAAIAPSILGYLEMARRHAKGLTTEWPYQSNALLGKLAPPGILANLLDLPWVLTLELGPLLLFPILLPRRIWRRAWNDPGLRLLLLSSVLSLAGFVSLRSHFTYNDFGQKIILVPMLAGVILAACILAPQTRPATLLNPLGWSLHDQSDRYPRHSLGWFIRIVLLLGLPVGLYQSPLAAIRRYITAESPLRMLAHVETLRAAREAGALSFLRHNLPSDAVVQAQPDVRRIKLAQLANKQIGVMPLEQDTMVFYPADAAAHERALQVIRRVLEQPTASPRCYDILRRHGITHVFVGIVERECWRGLEKFDDQCFFECVYHDAHTAVYALTNDAAVQSD